MRPTRAIRPQHTKMAITYTGNVLHRVAIEYPFWGLIRTICGVQIPAALVLKNDDPLHGRLRGCESCRRGR